LGRVLDIATNSPIARYNWLNRGAAPIGYTKGMAAAYALVYCNWRLKDPGSLEMARAASDDDINAEALSWLNKQFAAAGMRNDADGPDTLRHPFVLLTGRDGGVFREGFLCAKTIWRMLVPVQALSSSAFLKPVLHLQSNLPPSV
jgi:hypothetical protein